MNTQRWLALTAYAPLKVVAAANYLRYGPEGVRRFGPNSQEAPPVHPRSIAVEMTIKHWDKPAEKHSLTLFDSEPDTPFDLEGMNIWIGTGTESHLRVSWVWDFYRMFSGVKLEIEIPTGEVAAPWQQAATMLRELKPGDQIILSAGSRSGEILQVYPVDDPAVEV